jgi:hypothetical protein
MDLEFVIMRGMRESARRTKDGGHGWDAYRGMREHVEWMHLRRAVFWKKSVESIIAVPAIRAVRHCTQDRHPARSSFSPFFMTISVLHWYLPFRRKEMGLAGTLLKEC